MRPLLTILAAALLFGCGSDGPVAPRSGGFLQVAGTYAGPATFTAFTLEPEPITGTARFVVVQSDAQVTISGSFNFAYWDAPLACGAVTGTINETGFFTPTTSGRVPGPVEDDQCGRYTTTSQSLAFTGSEIQYEKSAETDSCGLFTILATLRRR